MDAGVKFTDIPAIPVSASLNALKRVVVVGGNPRNLWSIDLLFGYIVDRGETGHFERSVVDSVGLENTDDLGRNDTPELPGKHRIGEWLGCLDRHFVPPGSSRRDWKGKLVDIGTIIELRYVLSAFAYFIVVVLPFKWRLEFSINECDIFRCNADFGEG
ncbi:hypothetical protein BDV98DRAFT_398673 [Pterulicium gracile]|uniref:Uncharacterized protein n=1 Tax=Pterulicium gracile TaxID=1884261 RepID=A0A5C3QP34_9AGAR|nr:hypothetical protein BDV98DRAFT_398673 [Pterula gracilis]